MKPWMRTRFTSTKRSLRGASSGSVRLYCDMRPQTAKRAKRFTWRDTASVIRPPTLSKYTSIPPGQTARRATSRSARRAVFDRRVVAEVLGDVADLGVGAGQTHGAASFELRDLPDQAPDRAR